MRSERGWTPRPATGLQAGSGAGSFAYRQDAEHALDKSANAELLARLEGAGTHANHTVSCPEELMGVFHLNEISSATVYTGPVSLGGAMNVHVRVRERVRR
jgi:hypothetical protein